MLDCTGERVIEDEYTKSLHGYLIYLFHLATYDFCIPFVENKDVLDLGCGSGYGSFRLSKHCRNITGVDVAPDAVEYASTRYLRDNLTYQTIGPADASELPFPDGSFDVVVSFQVIEHLRDPDHYLAQIERVVSNDGVFIVATPDRTTRLLPMQKPWNEFHRFELNQRQLATKLTKHFNNVDLFGMTARRDVAAIELDRTARLKWTTLPFTFPGAPDWWRRPGLRMLKKAAGARAKQRSRPAFDAAACDFDQTDIEISPSARPAVNLLGVASGARRSTT